jgi:hypothetical protein
MLAMIGEEYYRLPEENFLPVVIVYVIAILIGLLLPVAAVALYAGIAVYLVVPGSRTGAAPTAHPPMNAAPAPTTPAGTGTAQCLR